MTLYLRVCVFPFPFGPGLRGCGFWGGNLVCVFAVWEFLRIFFHLLVSVFVWWSGGPMSSWGVGSWAHHGTPSSDITLTLLYQGWLTNKLRFAVIMGPSNGP